MREKMKTDPSFQRSIMTVMQKSTQISHVMSCTSAARYCPYRLGQLSQAPFGNPKLAPKFALSLSSPSVLPLHSLHQISRTEARP